MSLKKAVNRAICLRFPAARPIVFFHTTAIPVRSPKDRIPIIRSSSVIYKFLCDCGAVYFGRTNRCLAVRIREHVSQWLLEGGKGRSCSAISSHVLQCNCLRKNLRDHFSVIFRARNEQILRILEALSIKLFKPNLCMQKEHVMALLLPW